MSTSVTNVVSHFPDAENGFTTTLASTISSGATTVPLNSVAGYTNGEPAVFIVDPSDLTKKQAFTGIIDTSGVQLTSVVWTAGTNQSHSGGATVVDYPSATHMAMVSKGIKVNHTQKGNHKTLTDDNANEWIAQTSTASAVNELTVANAATGTSPTLSATGGDTNIDLKMTGKGTGKAYDDSITEWAFDFIPSGLIWSGDAYASTRNASMTAGFAYISGVRVTVAAVTARSFTASRDTYIDLSSDGVLTYTEVTNNAASPALSANNIRIGIIVTAAGSIAAAGSINQGQTNKVLPIASSVPYQVTDSLGNLICPRDPSRRILGYRERTSGSFATASTTAVQVTELSCPVIIPTSRRVRVTAWSKSIFNGTGAAYSEMTIWEGAVGGTQISTCTAGLTANNGESVGYADVTYNPTSSTITFNVGFRAIVGNTATMNAASTNPAYIKVELS